MIIVILLSIGSVWSQFDESNYVKSPKTASTKDSDVGKIAVDTHNYYRGLGGIPPLKWNQTLADFSFNYVKKLAAKCESVHSGVYMDNLARNWNNNYLETDGAWQVQNAIDRWYGEIRNYVYNPHNKKSFCEERNKHNGRDPKTGHFTMMMWADLTDLGCSYIACRRDAEFVNYTALVHCSYKGKYSGNKPAFSEEAADKLDCAAENVKFGGLPKCGHNKKCLEERKCAIGLGKYAVTRCSEEYIPIDIITPRPFKAAKPTTKMISKPHSKPTSTPPSKLTSKPPSKPTSKPPSKPTSKPTEDLTKTSTKTSLRIDSNIVTSFLVILFRIM